MISLYPLLTPVRKSGVRDNKTVPRKLVSEDVYSESSSCVICDNEVINIFKVNTG